LAKELFLAQAAPTTLDGNTIGPSNNIELNYGFLTQDASGDLYTVWVFAYANSDEDQFYLVGDAGTPTIDGLGDITTVTQTTTAYSGQDLTVLDGTALSLFAPFDAALNDFMRGDGSLTFAPANNDIQSIFGLGTYADLLPCFVGGTLIATDRGERPIETLQPGDLVLTKTSGLKPIRWVGSRSLSKFELRRKPKLRPIHIAQGALGGGTPTTDLFVSPQHRILVRSNIVQRMFGSGEVLVAAKHLLDIDGIEVVKDLSTVEYFHILFDQHEIVWSNGAETESLYTGSEALKALHPDAQDEIFALFPSLQPDTEISPMEMAAPFSTGRKGRRLAYRHAKNQTALWHQPSKDALIETRHY